VTAREAGRADRTEAAHEILEAADQRDVDADARDAAAEKRENDLDLARTLAPRDDVGYGDDGPERRNAALDRRSSKADRAASHDDRIQLAEGADADDPDRP